MHIHIYIQTHLYVYYASIIPSVLVYKVIEDFYHHPYRETFGNAAAAGAQHRLLTKESAKAQLAKSAAMLRKWLLP